MNDAHRQAIIEADWEVEPIIARARRDSTFAIRLWLALDDFRRESTLPREHSCKTCGATFTGKYNAKYCSTACRVAAHRQRQAAAADRGAASDDPMAQRVAPRPTTEDLTDMLAENMRRLHAGVISPAQANAVTRSASATLRSVETGLRVAKTMDRLSKDADRARSNVTPRPPELE